MVMTVVFVLATLSLLVWMVLVLFRGGFWRADQWLEHKDHGETTAKTLWPPAVAIVPARNEAPSVGRTVAALLEQDYPGSFAVVDDGAMTEPPKRRAAQARIRSASPSSRAPPWSRDGRVSCGRSRKG